MPVTDTLLNAGKVALFGTGSEASTDWIEINVNHTSGNGSVIEQIEAFEARFPEATFNVIFFVCGASDEFVETAHEPAEAGQPQAELSDAVRAQGEGGDLHFG